ncbi:MAG: UDP-2,3-diacylglucosamine diphosphatase [Bacteroidota bacterium]|nr:UDP-2,3-diacylglucosamine diphosphatase [Ignavibacteria bacterium]MCU7498373.1 UDP-2,3-diacylglucosamine diphosphatase [Ignavibacteria bacterium]MCU7512888.1 UDP-2,3-diacylglucosamine diphosphatase [Ignavibacteria bacterium]MCU7520267.1 UDP-2,3-diacylglucosamine diphosphatase [Ignavibacteria bacterium]MCU7526289.1 UDP-2,3-diacylglucosamine diphosphatase [Ignavibacteria bacterium]
MKDSYLFISDVHLGLQSKETEKSKERLLVKFLQMASEEARELYILGDLFDYWFEYRYVYQKGFFRTLTALQDLTESGTKVHYIIGNHDFSHRDFFGTEIGAKMYELPIEPVIDGKHFFLAHGDGLVKNDLGYKILKTVLRNKTVQKIYSLLHPDLGIAIASATSRKSRDYTTQKDYGEIDGMFEAAKEKIDSGFDYVIFGHSHRRALEKYNNGYYINLGSWLSGPCYGRFKDGCFSIVDWK